MPKLQQMLRGRFPEICVVSFSLQPIPNSCQVMVQKFYTYPLNDLNEILELVQKSMCEVPFFDKEMNCEFYGFVSALAPACEPK